MVLCSVVLVYWFACVSWVTLLLFFFFKQKTAYELRISDWSSDVCSSDLHSARTMPDTASSVAVAGPGSPRHSSAPTASAGSRVAIDITPSRDSQIGSTSCRERVWQYV